MTSNSTAKFSWKGGLLDLSKSRHLMGGKWNLDLNRLALSKLTAQLLQSDAAHLVQGYQAQETLECFFYVLDF